MKRITNKQPKPPIPPGMIETFAGALYRACPQCGSTWESGFVTSQKLCSPAGYRWQQRCQRCNRDYGTDDFILATLTGGQAA